MHAEERTRRAQRTDVKLARQAALAVSPIRAKLHGWQTRAAYLKVLVDRRLSSGEPIDEILAEAAAIAGEIERSQQWLSGSALPDPVRRHSRFQDTVRALSTASRAVDGVRQQPNSF